MTIKTMDPGCSWKELVGWLGRFGISKCILYCRMVLCLVATKTSNDYRLLVNRGEALNS